MVSDTADSDQKSETYSEAETEARREATLKVMLTTPHKAQKDTKSTGTLKRGRPSGKRRD